MLPRIWSRTSTPKTSYPQPISHATHFSIRKFCGTADNCMQQFPLKQQRFAQNFPSGRFRPWWFPLRIYIGNPKHRWWPLNIDCIMQTNISPASTHSLRVLYADAENLLRHLVFRITPRTFRELNSLALATDQSLLFGRLREYMYASRYLHTPLRARCNTKEVERNTHTQWFIPVMNMISFPVGHRLRWSAPRLSNCATIKMHKHPTDGRRRRTSSALRII